MMRVTERSRSGTGTMTKLAQLKHPDTMYLKTAVGWIQLGDYDSANDELENIRAGVLNLRCFIYSHHKQWNACLDVATAIVKMTPDRVLSWVNKAYSMRWANDGSIEKTKPVMLEVAELFPGDSTIQNHLACYCAQPG